MKELESKNCLGRPKGQYRKRRYVTLIITHRCNLNCVYCYEAHKGNRRMPVELAKQIILREFEFAKEHPEYEEIQFDFFGGEPFIEFGLMREIMEWCWSEDRPVPYVFFTTTNGTLLTPEIKEWIRRNARRFCVGLSLDGTPAMQKMNRNCGNDSIDPFFFRDVFPEQGVKMTISCDSIETLAEGVIYLHENKIGVEANCGYGMPWGEKSYQVYARELHKLADYYLEHPEQPVIRLLAPAFDALLLKIPAKKYCGTGTQMITYDVDGCTYPCHMFTPLVLGCKKAEDLQKKQDFSDAKNVSDPRCANCPVRGICPTCYGFNYRDTGSIACREDAVCRLFQIQMEEAAMFQIRHFLKNRKREERISRQYLQYLKGVKFYLEHKNEIGFNNKQE